MTTLFNLIGEQPIPNLLPVLFLKPGKIFMLYTQTTADAMKRIEKLVPALEKIKVEPYDLLSIIETIQKKCLPGDEMIFNITGGTKVMALAAFKVAGKHSSKMIYIQSEEKTNTLYSYQVDNNLTVKQLEQTELPELVDIDFYLKAHLPGYKVDGFHKETRTNHLSSGGMFEKAVFDVLKERNFEVMAGVRPAGVGQQVEIDLIFRPKGTNQVGIAEIKLGDAQSEGPKKGLDQLVMASERDYLGTYTKRFLVTARNLRPDIKELALKHKINIIEIQDYNNNGSLSGQSSDLLVSRINEKLK